MHDRDPSKGGLQMAVGFGGKAHETDELARAGRAGQRDREEEWDNAPIVDGFKKFLYSPCPWDQKWSEFVIPERTFVPSSIPPAGGGGVANMRS